LHGRSGEAPGRFGSGDVLDRQRATLRDSDDRGGDTRAARVRDGMEKARDARKPWQERFPGAPSEDFFPFAEPFEEKGYTFFAWQPSGDGAPRHFVLQAKKDGEVVREVTVPMDYPNQWGVDVADVQSLEAATETLIGELP